LPASSVLAWLWGHNITRPKLARVAFLHQTLPTLSLQQVLTRKVDTCLFTQIIEQCKSPVFIRSLLRKPCSRWSALWCTCLPIWPTFGCSNFGRSHPTFLGSTYPLFCVWPIC
jgi:hypothetical protein